MEATSMIGAGQRTPEAAVRAQNVNFSLACEHEHGESEGLHLARAQVQPPPTQAQNRHQIEQRE
jgi:hypothetical protein